MGIASIYDDWNACPRGPWKPTSLRATTYKRFCFVDETLNITDSFDLSLRNGARKSDGASAWWLQERLMMHAAGKPRHDVPQCEQKVSTPSAS